MSATPAGPPRPVGAPRRWLGPVGERDFGLLWSAATLSLIGDYAFRLAFIAYVITATHSATTLAAATAALLVPPLAFYLLGGVVGDRARSRKRVMVLADVGRALAAGAVAFVVVAAPSTDSRAVAWVVVAGVLIGIGTGFFLPASFAFLTEIVPADRLTAANSANSISRQVGIIVGPIIGGGLVGLAGVGAAFAFDAATFLASALLLLAIRRRRTVGEAGQPGRGPRGVLRDARAGLRHIAGTRWLLISCVVGALANAVFAGNLDISVPLILAPSGVDEAARLGLFYSLQGAGALLGAVVLARASIQRAGTVAFRMLAVMATAITLIGPLPWLGATYLMAIAYGFGLHYFNSIYPSIIQSHTPVELLSRVGSFVFLAFHGLMPLGTLLIGPIIAATSPRLAATLTGAAALGLTLAVLRSPSIRALRRTPAEPAAPPAGPAPIRSTVEETA